MLSLAPSHLAGLSAIGLTPRDVRDVREVGGRSVSQPLSTDTTARVRIASSPGPIVKAGVR